MLHTSNAKTALFSTAKQLAAGAGIGIPSAIFGIGGLRFLITLALFIFMHF